MTGISKFVFFIMILGCLSFAVLQETTLKGAYRFKAPDHEEILSFQDGYFMHTAFSKDQKRFLYSRGGTFTVSDGKLQTKIEFDTRYKSNVGKSESLPLVVKGRDLSLEGKQWNQVDAGEGELAGNWRITGRKQGGDMVSIQPGARKTLKLLTGTRFQWAAINTATGEFFGTGGGTYTFRDGRYTENIEFFSRDSTRVGASLSFDGSVKGKDWSHSGLSSKGDPISEVWSRD